MRVRRLLPYLLAILGLAYLGAMVVSGAMPVQRQFVRFEAKGLLTLPPDRIARIELRHGPDILTLLRRGETRWTTPEGTDPGGAGSRIETALRMMRNSAPVREMPAAELTGIDTAPFGLDPPRLSVRLFAEGSEPVLAAGFGERNPEGYLQYMRLDGDGRLFLMSRFIGEEWEEVMAAALPR